MISKHQFQRMRVKVILPFEIRLIVFTNKMVNKRNRDNKRKIAHSIKVDELKYFPFLIRVKLFLKIADQMEKDIGVFFGCGLEQEGFHEKPLISFVNLIGGIFFRISYQFSHDSIMLLAVRED